MRRRGQGETQTNLIFARRCYTVLVRCVTAFGRDCTALSMLYGIIIVARACSKQICCCCVFGILHVAFTHASDGRAGRRCTVHLLQPNADARALRVRPNRSLGATTRFLFVFKALERSRYSPLPPLNVTQFYQAVGEYNLVLRELFCVCCFLTITVNQLRCHTPSIHLGGLRRQSG